MIFKQRKKKAGIPKGNKKQPRSRKALLTNLTFLVLSCILFFECYLYIKIPPNPSFFEQQLRKLRGKITLTFSPKPPPDHSRNIPGTDLEEKSPKVANKKQAALSKLNPKVKKELVQTNHSSEQIPTSVTPSSPPARSFSLPDVENMFHFDQEQNAFVVHSINFLPVEPFDSDEFYRLLAVLNKTSGNFAGDFKRGSIKNILNDADYNEYHDAYTQLDESYPDIYLWTFLTSKEAKLKFFGYLLKKYSDENAEWHYYEKDKADCTQFSERTYFFMYPGEIIIEDQEYFNFLFDNEENLIERKKNINKIPTMAYATIERFYFQDLVEHLECDQVRGHAMVAFKLTSGVGSWFVGEPQNGNFANLFYLDSIIPAPAGLTFKTSSILTLGKIKIPYNPTGEAVIVKRHLKSFIGKGTPNRVDILTEEPTVILHMLKKYVEQEHSDKEYVVNEFFELIKDALNSKQEMSLVQLQENASKAMDIFLSELERVTKEANTQENPEDTIMEFSTDLERRANLFSYTAGKQDKNYIENLLHFINHFRATALSKLQ